MPDALEKLLAFRKTAERLRAELERTRGAKEQHQQQQESICGTASAEEGRKLLKKLEAEQGQAAKTSARQTDEFMGEWRSKLKEVGIEI